jgi:hypothetical protein
LTLIFDIRLNERNVLMKNQLDEVANRVEWPSSSDDAC